MYVVFIHCIALYIVAIKERIDELVALLPTNCYSTVCKLRKMINFTDVDERMSDLLSECDDARVINDQLLSYVMNKCATNALVLYDVLVNLVPTNMKKQLQYLGMYIHMYTYICTYAPTYVATMYLYFYVCTCMYLLCIIKYDST